VTMESSPLRNGLTGLVRVVGADVAGLFSRASAERFFCLSAGNSGSKYLVALLRANGVPRCFHEKPPQLDDAGVAYWLDGSRRWRIELLLRLTRRSVYLESSNRLFSLAPLIREVFPGARFIHLHRDPRELVNSSMNKTIWPSVFDRPRLRYRSRLSGDPSWDPFERTCAYWANINERILRDLADQDGLSLRFDDLVGRELPVRRIEPVNTKKRITLAEKRYESHLDWPETYRRIFARRCGTLAELLGYETAGEGRRAPEWRPR
jgi:hypothetical protein